MLRLYQNMTQAQDSLSLLPENPTMQQLGQAVAAFAMPTLREWIASGQMKLPAAYAAWQPYVQEVVAEQEANRLWQLAEQYLHGVCASALTAMASDYQREHPEVRGSLHQLFFAMAETLLSQMPPESQALLTKWRKGQALDLVESVGLNMIFKEIGTNLLAKAGYTEEKKLPVPFFFQESVWSLATSFLGDFLRDTYQDMAPPLPIKEPSAIEKALAELAADIGVSSLSEKAASFKETLIAEGVKLKADGKLSLLGHFVEDAEEEIGNLLAAFADKDQPTVRKALRALHTYTEDVALEMLASLANGAQEGHVLATIFAKLMQTLPMSGPMDERLLQEIEHFDELPKEEQDRLLTIFERPILNLLAQANLVSQDSLRVPKLLKKPLWDMLTKSLLPKLLLTTTRDLSGLMATKEDAKAKLAGTPGEDLAEIGAQAFKEYVPTLIASLKPIHLQGLFGTDHPMAAKIERLIDEQPQEIEHLFQAMGDLSNPAIQDAFEQAGRYTEALLLHILGNLWQQEIRDGNGNNFFSDITLRLISKAIDSVDAIPLKKFFKQVQKYHGLPEGDDKEKVKQKLIRYFQPLAKQVLADAGVSAATLPVPEGLKDSLFAKLQDSLLPGFLLNVCQDLTGFVGEKKQLDKRLEHLYGSSSLSAAAKVIGRYVEEFLPNHLRIHQEDLFEQLKSALEKATASGEITPRLIKELVESDPSIIKEALAAFGDLDDPRVVDKLMPAFGKYVEAFVVKMVHGISEQIDGIEEVYRKQDKRFGLDMAIKMLEMASDHFEKLNSVKDAAREDLAWRLGHQHVLKGFEELARRYPEKHTPLHRGVPNLTQGDYEGILLTDEERAGDVAERARLVKARKKRPTKEQEKRIADKKREIRTQGFYAPFAKDMLALAGISEKNIPAPLRKQFYALFESQIAPLITEQIFTTLLSPSMMNKLLLSIVDSLDQSLEGPEDASPPEEPPADETQRRLNEQCGRLIVNLANLVPDTLAKKFFKFKTFQNMSAEALGRVFRQQFKDESLLDIIRRSVESGITAWNPQVQLHVTTAADGTEVRRDLKMSGDLTFNLPKTKEEVEQTQKLREREDKALEAHLKKRIVRTFRAQAKWHIRNLFAKPWRAMHRHLNQWIERCFGEYGTKIKQLVDSICSTIFFEWVGTALSILFYPLTWLLWHFVDRHVKNKADKFIRHMQMEIHEDLVYKLASEFVNMLKVQGSLQKANFYKQAEDIQHRTEEKLILLHLRDLLNSPSFFMPALPKQGLVSCLMQEIGASPGKTDWTLQELEEALERAKAQFEEHHRHLLEFSAQELQTLQRLTKDLHKQKQPTAENMLPAIEFLEDALSTRSGLLPARFTKQLQKLKAKTDWKEQDVTTLIQLMKRFAKEVEQVGQLKLFENDKVAFSSILEALPISLARIISQQKDLNWLFDKNGSEASQQRLDKAFNMAQVKFLTLLDQKLPGSSPAAKEKREILLQAFDDMKGHLHAHLMALQPNAQSEPAEESSLSSEL